MFNYIRWYRTTVLWRHNSRVADSPK